MPNQPDAYEGYSPAAANADTEAVNPPPGTAPGSPGTAATQAQRLSTADTTGTAAAGIGAALPGGSTADVIPWAGAGQAGSGTGQAPQSDYAVKEQLKEGQYGFGPGQPDTGEVYGGTPGSAGVTQASPYPWVPSSTALTGTLDTQVGGGSALITGLGTPPAYRAPSAGVAASVKDTSLTDIMGSMIAAMPLTDSSYSALNIDTSYIGSPAAPAALSTQTDAFTSTAASPTRYYASKQGVVPSSLVVRDVTTSANLVANTDYTVVTAGSGAKTSLYITLTAGTNYTVGNNVSLIYSYGTPQYFDSNLPTAASQANVDTFAIGLRPVQLSTWGITTAASALAVHDVTQNADLVYNTDYTVTTITEPYTPGGSYAETPKTTYAITLKLTSATAKAGDTITVGYNFTTSVPAAPGLGAAVAYTDTGVSFTGTPVALAHAGVITPPASLAVVNTTAGARLGLVQVLNVDYTITMTGSGSTLAYSIARLAGSTHSNSGDTVSVSYSTGNAAYFTSGPVLPVDKGVWVPFTPPSGSIAADYYLIQASDMGTMFVPASGQPVDYGQMTPAGGGSYGLPAFQSDSLTISSSVPASLTKAGVITPPGQLIVRDTTSAQADPLQAGGQVLIYGYDYTITQTGTGPWTAYTISRVASSVNSADGDTIIVSYWYDTMGTVPLTCAADTVTAVGGHAALTNKDIAVAPSQLIVLDTTITKTLAYGLDFTVTTGGTGPAQTMTINLITTGPAGAGATDALTVYYGYGVVLGAVFRQGLVPNQVPIYTPAGAQRTGGQYQLAIAAGNRAGLGPFSNWSDWAAPLNYAAPQPGAQGTTTAGTGALDPRNTINPIYKPDGTIKAGTGLGM